MERAVVKQIVAVIVCIACYETVICSECLAGCLTCTPGDYSNPIATCTNCSNGFLLAKDNDANIRSRLSKAYEKEILGLPDYTQNRSGMLCYKCSGILEGCDRCELKDSYDLTCTSCIETYYAISSGPNQTGICQECSKLTDRCERCQWKNGFGVLCTSCMEGYVIGYSGNSYQIPTCEECTEVVENCERCEWSDSGIECTRCLGGYKAYGPNCYPSSLTKIVLIVVVVAVVPLTMLPYLVGILRLYEILQKRNAARRRTEGDNTRMSAIKMAGLIITAGVTVVVPFLLGLYEISPQRLKNWLGLKWNRFRTVQDTIPASRKLEMNLLGEDGETCYVHIGGSIYYNAKKVLGSGSYGVVFEGRCGLHKNKPVAIKKVDCLSAQDAKEVLNINKEIKTMETLDTAENTNIIHFIDSYIIENTVYLAFELAIGTLVDYVLPSNFSWRITLAGDDVMRGIVAGLKYTHNKSIVHRDLKPKNIFIVEHSVSGLKAVIGDFGQAKAMTGDTNNTTGNHGSIGYIAPEVWKAMSVTETVSLGTNCNEASDIFSLGLVVYYTMSLGNHPYSYNLTAQDSISKGNPPSFHHIADLINLVAYEDMLTGMLNNNPHDRPSIEVVSEHPALWTSDKIIKYFGLKSDEFEGRIKKGSSNKNLLEDPNLIPGENWMNQLPLNMGPYLRSYKLPNRSSPMYSGKEKEVRFLLRAIRNTNGHYHEYPQKTQAELGVYPEGHVNLWLKVCPGLLMHVYNII